MGLAELWGQENDIYYSNLGLTLGFPESSSS